MSTLIKGGRRRICLASGKCEHVGATAECMVPQPGHRQLNVPTFLGDVFSTVIAFPQLGCAVVWLISRLPKTMVWDQGLFWNTKWELVWERRLVTSGVACATVSPSTIDGNYSFLINVVAGNYLRDTRTGSVQITLSSW